MFHSGKTGALLIRQLTGLYMPAILCLVVLVLGLIPETTVDSAKYAAVSRSMYESNDLIHLTIRGEPYDQKPPLLFWLAVASFKLFGMSIFTFKLPNLIYSFLGVYSTYRLGRLIFDRRTGLCSAMIFMTGEAFFLYNMDVHTDMLLTANIIFSVWQLAEYNESKRPLNFILGFAGAGLAMLSKGVIGIIVPGIAVGGYLLYAGRYRDFFSARWIAGVFIAILVLSPAITGLWNQFGEEGLKFYFWSNIAHRIGGQGAGRRPDYAFSFHTIIYLVLPWSMYAYAAFVKDLRSFLTKADRPGNKKPAYCYSVIIVLSAVICLSRQQSPHYLLPAVPFISIITAKLITDISFNGLYPLTYRILILFRNITAAVLWLTILVTCIYFFPVMSPLIWIMLTTMAILFVLSLRRRLTADESLTIPAVITILALAFTANTVYMPSALKYHAPIQASYLYNREADEGSPLFTYDYSQYETYFYPKKISVWLADKEQLETVVKQGQGWVFTSAEGYRTIEAYDSTAIAEKHEFPYKKLTNISLKFLDPRTREKTLQTMYLVKLRQR